MAAALTFADSIPVLEAFILEDCERFFQRFHIPIREGPSHLYASALVFCPECSLAKNAARLAPLWTPVIKQGQVSGWSPLIRTLNHPENILSVVLSPDGKHLASGCGDSTVRIWDVASGTLIGKPLEGHD